MNTAADRKMSDLCRQPTMVLPPLPPLERDSATAGVAIDLTKDQDDVKTTTHLPVRVKLTKEDVKLPTIRSFDQFEAEWLSKQPKEAENPVLSDSESDYDSESESDSGPVRSIASVYRSTPSPNAIVVD